MDHSDALKIQAAEKYLLNELTVEERDSFEDHYFGCEECSEEVRAGMQLRANVREVLRESAALIQFAPRRERRNWFAWVQPSWAVAALVIFAAALSYQSLVIIPNLRSEAAAVSPQALPAVFLMASRGVPAATVTVGKNTPFGLNLDIPPAPGFSFYECEVQTEQSNPRFLVRISAEQAHDTVQLFVPGGLLASGHYVLVVRGKRADTGAQTAGDELARYPFTIQVK
jgi:hypothetical protein